MLKDSYETRIVIFIDILGFGSLIKKEESSCTIYDLLTFFKRVHYQGNYKDIILSNNDISFKSGDIELDCLLGNPRYSFFSDNVVISINPLDIDHNIYRVVQFMAHVQLELLLKKQTLIRGGLSYGKIFHDENMIFGPALVAAYEIESRKIINPFIGVDEKIYTYYQELRDYVKQDSNKNEYLDFLSALCVDDEDIKIAISNLSQMILHAETDKIKNKVRVLYDYFVSYKSFSKNDLKTE